MARKKTNTATIITDTTEEPVKKVSNGSGELVYIACGMQLGIRFDDVDNGNGGVKTVTFPGVNHLLRGKSKGVLLGPGNAVLTAIPRADWEDIVRKHGRERYFTCLPPLFWEMKS